MFARVAIASTRGVGRAARTIVAQPSQRTMSGATARCANACVVSSARMARVVPGGIVARVAHRASGTAPAAAPSFSLSGLGKRFPFLFQLGICTAQACAGDLLIQKYVEHKEKIDWQRTSVFVAFGLVYLGGFQYLVYSIWMPRIFPYAKAWADMAWKRKVKDRKGFVTMWKQIAFDNFVHNPFMYFPAFYIFKSAFQLGDAGKQQKQHDHYDADMPVALALSSEGRNGEANRDEAGGRSAWTMVKDGMGAYGKNFWKDNIAMCALVIPGDILTFGAPMWLRLPANHLVSFFWVCYLSFMRGGEAEVQQSAEDEEVSAQV